MQVRAKAKRGSFPLPNPLPKSLMKGRISSFASAWNTRAAPAKLEIVEESEAAQIPIVMIGCQNETSYWSILCLIKIIYTVLLLNNYNGGTQRK